MSNSVGTSTQSSFLDIHQNDEPELTAEEYLPQDLVRNWHAAWKNDRDLEKPFVEHKGSIEAKRHLWYKSWVTITGYSGDGKTSIAEHLVSYFAKEPPRIPDLTSEMYNAEYVGKEFIKSGIGDEDRACYTPVYINNPEEYRERMDPNLCQLFILDDIFGEAVMDWRKVEEWRPYLEDMLWEVTRRKPQSLMVICVNRGHLEGAPSDVAQLEWFKPANVIDLHKVYRFTEDDILKLSMFSRHEFYWHQQSKNLKSSALLYRMRNLVAKFKMDGEDFFKAPWDRVLAEINQIYNVDRIVYYTLAVSILLDGNLNLSKPTLQHYDGRTRQVLEQLINLLNVPLEVNQSKMRFAADLLTGFFFRSVGKWEWEITHSRVFSLCLASLLWYHPKGIIEMLSVESVCKFVRADHVGGMTDMELVVEVNRENYESLAARLMLGITSGYMSQILPSQSFQNKHFVHTFFGLVKKARQLGQVVFQKDRVYGRSLFYWACHYGHGYLVELILSETEEFNLKDDARFQKELAMGYVAACASLSESTHVVLKSLQCLAGVSNEVGKLEPEGGEVYQLLGNDFHYLLSMEAPVLHIACLKGHHNAVDYLIGIGADIEKSTLDAAKPIHRAAGRMDKEGAMVVQTLIRHNADIKSNNGRQYTGLGEAVDSGSVASVRHLVTAGSDTRQGQGCEGPSYIAKAIQRRDIDLVRRVLSWDPVMNGTPERDMFTPLCLAVQTDDPAIVNELFYKHVDINYSGTKGWTALHVACVFSSRPIVETLIGHGADVNASDQDRNTPLHIAAEKGRLDICELLLSKGAKTELMNRKRETPLVCAARGNHATVTWLLLRDGMDLHSHVASK